MTGVTLALSLLAIAGAAPKVVMPEWTRVEVSAELGTFYADHLAKSLRAEGIEVITASELGALLGLERQRQLLGCSADSTACFAELGNALGCDGTIVVSLAKLDQTFTANIKVLSSRSGAVLAEASAEADSQRGLLGELRDAASVLARGLRPESTSTPGAAQRAPTVRGRSFIPAVAAAALVVLGSVSAVLAQRDFDTVRSPDTQTWADATAIAGRGEAWRTTTWVAFSLATAAIVVTALMFFLGAGE